MDIEHYNKIFCRYGGMMRTGELEAEKIYYRNVQRLVQEGCIEKSGMDITSGWTMKTSARPVP